MNSTNKKSPAARGIPQTFGKQPQRLPQLKPVVAQLKTPMSAQSVKRPVAPPVYCPQPVPKVLQKKCSATQPPVLQPQRTAAPQTRSPQIVLGKGIIQRVIVKVPAGQVLNHNPTVLQQYDDGDHVTLCHGLKDALRGEVDVKNIHYTCSDGPHYYWDDRKNGSTDLKLRAGTPPSKKMYKRTLSQAKKFGLTLEKPPSVVAAEAASAAKKREAKDLKMRTDLDWFDMDQPAADGQQPQG